MTYSIDANVLLYASDRTSPWHQAAKEFLERRAADRELLCVAWLTLMSYVRIATHPRIFATPLAPVEAMRNVQALLDLPRVRAISEQDGFMSVYREVSGRMAVRGNLVPDAHLAAILRQHDVRTIYTRNSDFRKFETLEVRDPFA